MIERVISHNVSEWEKKREKGEKKRPKNENENKRTHNSDNETEAQSVEPCIYRKVRRGRGEVQREVSQNAGSEKTFWLCEIAMGKEEATEAYPERERRIRKEKTKDGRQK